MPKSINFRPPLTRRKFAGFKSEWITSVKKSFIIRCTDSKYSTYFSGESLLLLPAFLANKNELMLD